jgi:opacity protein-like surface antigen
MKNHKLVLTTLLTLVSGTALVGKAVAAQDQYLVPRVYFGGSEIMTPNGSVYNILSKEAKKFKHKLAVDNKKSDYAYGASLGYQYDLTSFWSIGAELGYFNMGKNQYTGKAETKDEKVLDNKTDLRVNHVDALADVTLRQGMLSFSAKGGLAYVHQKMGAVQGNADLGVTASPANKLSKYKPVVGFGVGLAISNISFDINYLHTLGKDPSMAAFRKDGHRADKVYATHSILASVGYRFNIA